MAIPKGGGRTVSSRDIFPIAGITSGGMAVGLDGGALTVGFELGLPSGHTICESDYDAIITKMHAAVMCLPEWTVVHIQNVYLYATYRARYPDDARFLEIAYENRYDGTRYLVHRCLVYVTAAGGALVNRPASASPLGTRADRTRVSAPVVEKVRAFEMQCMSFEDVLRSCRSLRVRRLEYRDWMGEYASPGIVQRLMHLGSGTPTLSDLCLTNDSVGCLNRRASVFEIRKTRQFRSDIMNSVREIVTLSADSSFPVFLSAGSAIGTQLDCEHTVNHYIVRVPREELERQQEADQNSMRKGDIEQRASQMHYEGKEAWLTDSVRGLDSVLTSTLLCVWAPDDRRSQAELYGKVETAFTNLGVKRKLCIHGACALWYATLPCCSASIGQESLYPSSLDSALCLVSWDGFESGMKGGVMRLMDRTRRIPVEIDIQKGALKRGLIFAFNQFYLGAAGTGKSFYVSQMCYRMWARGQSVFIIDKGQSYRTMSLLISEETGGRDGQFYAWSRSHEYSFNPFVGWRSWLREDGTLDLGSDVEDATDEAVIESQGNGASAFISILQTIWTPRSGWNNENKPVLTRTVQEFIKFELLEKDCLDGTLPVFDEYVSYVRNSVAPALRSRRYGIGTTEVGTDRFDVEGFLSALSGYCRGGQFGGLLNNPRPADLFSSRFVVFEVDQLAQIGESYPEMYSIVILMIINAFNLKMRKDAEMKTLVIEEAWKAIATPQMAQYIRSLWKVARKYSASAVVVSQEIADISNSPIVQTAILENTDIMGFLDQSKHISDPSELVRTFHFTPQQLAQLFSVNRGVSGREKQIFLRVGQKWSGVFTNAVSVEQAIVSESFFDEKTELYALKERTGSLRSAVTILADRKRKSNKPVQYYEDSRS